MASLWEMMPVSKNLVFDRVIFVVLVYTGRKVPLRIKCTLVAAGGMSCIESLLVF